MKCFRRMVFIIFAIVMIFSINDITYAETLGYDNNIDTAINWLISMQNDNGSWNQNMLTTLAVLDTIQSKETTSEDEAIEWIKTKSISNNDFLSRYLLIDNLADYELADLLALQNSDGGFGIQKNYGSDTFDTLLAAKAMLARDEEITDASRIDRAIYYLVSRQNEDGSWSYIKGGEPNICLTSEIIILLADYLEKDDTKLDVFEFLNKGGQYLLSQKDSIASFSMDETILTYHAILKSIGYKSIQNFEQQIIELQEQNGSWNNSIYTTCLAIDLLESLSKLSFATINDIIITNYDGNEQTSFGAYEDIYMSLDVTYVGDSDNIEEHIYVEDSEGNIISTFKEDVFYFSAEKMCAGQYIVKGFLKDTKTNAVVDYAEKEITISETFSIDGCIFSVSDEDIYIGDEVELSIDIDLIIKSNISNSAEVKIQILDDEGNVAAEEMFNENIAEEEVNHSLPTIKFVPNTENDTVYKVNVSAKWNESEIYEDTYEIKILPQDDSSGLDASYEILGDKEELNPTSDSVDINLKMTGYGEVGTGTGSEKPIDLVVILDYSGSMQGEPWEQELLAAERAIDMLGENDRGSIVLFNNYAYTVQVFTSDKELLKNRVNQYTYPHDGTNVGRGIERALLISDNYSDDSREKVFIVVSDGYTNSYATLQASKAAAKGIVIHTLGIGNVYEQMMKDIANITGGNYMLSPTLEDIADIMSSLAGGVFTASVKNVTYSITIPNANIIIDETVSTPMPDEVIQQNGKTELRWNFDEIAIDEEVNIQLRLLTSNLEVQKELVICENIYCEYTDANGCVITKALDDIILQVTSYSIQTSVSMDKSEYSSKEDLNIVVNIDNEKNYPYSVYTEVFIVDEKGALVDTVAEKTEVSLDAISSNLSEYVWNTNNTLAGNYLLKTVVYIEDEIVEEDVKEFSILKDGEVRNNLALDKQEYICGEDVIITDIIKNKSTNYIESDLVISMSIVSDTGETIWETTTENIQLLAEAAKEITEYWNTEQYQPGDYMVVVHIDKGNENIITEEKSFTIVEATEGLLGITGTIVVDEVVIYPSDTVNIDTQLCNSGNTNITGVQQVIQLIDVDNNEVVYEEISELINLTVGETYTYTFQLDGYADEINEYMLVQKAVSSEFGERLLGSTGYKVSAPFDIGISEVIRPRVLVYADEENNIQLAETVLNEQEVYYTIATTSEEFIEELKTDKYNLYIMMSTKSPLTGHDDELLVSEIEKGKGLVIFGQSNGDNLKNYDLIGGKFKGSSSNLEFTTDYKGNEISFEGKIQKIEITTGIVLGTVFDKKDELPLIIENTYGEGKVLYFAFNIGECSGEIDQILVTAITDVMPLVQDESGIKEYEICISAHTDISGGIELCIPENVQILWSDGITEGDKIVWEEDLVKGEEKTLRIIVKDYNLKNNISDIVASYYIANEEKYYFNAKID